jgi:glycosyltransferase involved in cell wall biosynthesis
VIVINARFLTQPITGVQRYAIELCNRLPDKIRNNQVVFVAPKVPMMYEINDSFKIYNFGVFKGQLWEQIDLPLFLKKNNSPLLINLVGIGPIFYSNKIMALYDLAFKHYPEWFAFKFQKAYNILIPQSIKRARVIITDSEYVKKDIIKTYHVNSDKIEVIYAAPSGKFEFRNLVREKFILTVSSIDPRKNLKRVLEAYKYLKSDYRLIVVGSKNKTFKELRLQDDLLNEKVVFTGYLSDEELIELYNKAEIFIYASLFEGFGIPPLEAQACGCPCIVSNTTALPEVYLDSVEYCDPYSKEDIELRLFNILKDKTRRNKLRAKGFENIKRYSWDNSASKLVDIIKKIL